MNESNLVGKYVGELLKFVHVTALSETAARRKFSTLVGQVLKTSINIIEAGRLSDMLTQEKEKWLGN